jgi:hypothetical protein
VNFADVAARLNKLTRDKELAQQSLSPLKESLARAKADFKAATDLETKIATEFPKLEKAVADARQALEKATQAEKAAELAGSGARQQADAVGQLAAKIAELGDKLPTDSGLAEAFTKITAEAGELSSLVSKTEQAFGAALAARKTAAKELAEAEAGLAQQASLRPTPDRLHKLQYDQLAAEHNLSEANFTTAAIDRQMAMAKAILDYKTIADAAKAQAAWAAIVDHWTVAGQTAPLRPLTPEQLAASTMQATGSFQQQIAAADAKLEKSPPEAIKNAPEDDKPRVKANLTELELLSQLRGAFTEFVRQYGGSPGQDFQATVNQALFFGNGNTIDVWLKPAGENLAARLAKIDDATQLADEMTWAIFSRPASEREKSNAADYLKKREDRAAAIGEMVWALLSSTEFRFNH